MMSISPGDGIRLIQGIMKILTFPAHFPARCMVGGCLLTTQANNTKLNFARVFLRRFSLFISCWKEVINLTHWSFPILSVMIVDTVSGTTAAIFWQWRNDLQNYRDVDSKILWPLSQFLIFITQTLNSTTCQPGRYTCSHQVWNSFFPLCIITWLPLLHTDRFQLISSRRLSLTTQCQVGPLLWVLFRHSIRIYI